MLLVCAHTPQLEDTSHAVLFSTTLMLYTGHVTQAGLPCLLPALCATKTQSARAPEVEQQLQAYCTCTPNVAGIASANAGLA